MINDCNIFIDIWMWIDGNLNMKFGIYFSEPIDRYVIVLSMIKMMILVIIVRF